MGTEVYDSLPWIEKYRPYDIKQLSLSEYTRERIANMISKKNIQNIILKGPPGVGKTSTVRCLARELYGSYYEHMVMELNASDDRGISIKDAIENFRRSYVHIRDEDKELKGICKLVILDEADNMTDKAKYIITTFLENNSDEIRFAFTCNTKNNILPSIQSRCLMLNYQKIPNKIIYQRLYGICRVEKIITPNMDQSILKKIESGLNAISEITDGDLRNAINMLQLTYNRFGAISRADVYEIYDKPRPELSREIISACIRNDMGTALQKAIDMKLNGYSGMDIALGMILALKMTICDDIPEHQRIGFMKTISYTMYCISKGVDTVLEMSACISELCMIAQKNSTVDVQNKKIVKKLINN